MDIILSLERGGERMRMNDDETLKRFIFSTESYSLKIYILRKD